MNTNLLHCSEDLHQPHTIRVWDLPTRIFHWMLAFSVITLLVTGTVGGAAMEWHLRFGYVVCTLLLFRIVWGFVGGYWSQFRQFLFLPSTTWRYIRGRSLLVHEVGHSPLGSLSVWGLLLILGVQVATGLISDDEISTQGPFYKLVSNATSLFATSYHKHWGKWLMLILLILHVSAILIYLFKKRQNLIKPMILGDKSLKGASNLMATIPHSQDGLTQRALAFVIFASIACAVAYAVQRFG
jgi:cytochrome b